MIAITLANIVLITLDFLYALRLPLVIIIAPHILQQLHRLLHLLAAFLRNHRCQFVEQREVLLILGYHNGLWKLSLSSSLSFNLSRHLAE